ncbi:hypothetical protein VTG60DRAFT_4175 [Thermothelomyces hinnuleus]
MTVSKDKFCISIYYLPRIMPFGTWLTRGGISPLVEWHARRDDGRPHAGDDATGDDHGERVRPRGAGLKPLAEAYHRHAAESSVAAAQSVGDGVCKQHVAQPRAEIVDGRDESAPGRVWLTQGLLEARVDEHGGQDADIVPRRVGKAMRVSFGQG